MMSLKRWIEQKKCDQLYNANVSVWHSTEHVFTVAECIDAVWYVFYHMYNELKINFFSNAYEKDYAHFRLSLYALLDAYLYLVLDNDVTEICWKISNSIRENRPPEFHMRLEHLFESDLEEYVFKQYQTEFENIAISQVPALLCSRFGVTLKPKKAAWLERVIYSFCDELKFLVNYPAEESQEEEYDYRF